ncbi:MAG TPA: carboxypeptidase regulatory-like domain-containing protein [Thermoplasmatales archaeon]|nr:carboxypeptidase regulatory-like domain-containing protein [Thermoplasmatales archaeon]HEX08481.1 carboxypeptidase regulatory-like domain-containing protein [Thermoplasmatales archaeon]
MVRDRKVTILVVSLLILFSPVVLATFACAADVQSITISGMVLDSDGNPVAYATVTVKGVLQSEDLSELGLEAFKSYTTTTSLDGSYQLQLKAYFSTYMITVSKDGYRPATDTVTVTGDRVTKDFSLERETPPPADVWIYAQFGKFDVNRNTGEITGDYVSFRIQNGSILSYSVKDRVLFDVIYSNALFESIKSSGSELIITGPGESYEVVVHDNPTGYLKILSGNDIIFSFSNEYNLTLDENLVNISLADNFSASILSTNDLELKDNVVTAKGNALFRITGLAREFESDLAEARELIDKAILEGKVGAEVSIRNESGVYEDDSMIYDSSVSIDVNASPSEILLVVDGKNTQGKTIVINTDRSIFKNLDKINITYDNKPIDMADDIFDVLDPTDDGSNVEYGLFLGKNGAQILVSIPHFSKHVIRILSFSIEPEILMQYVAIAIFCGVIVIIMASFGMFRKTY